MNKLAKHPNIVYMLEFHYEPACGRVVFIFELMDMSLYDFIKTKRRRFPETKVRSYLYQILKGLDHLHTNGLFHRDIKPENILVKLPHTHGPHYQRKDELVKLADFGSIRGIFSKPPYTEYISTRWYRSPECLLTVGYYGPKMDVWATGCVLFEMLTLKPLFPGHDEIDQLFQIHAILGTPSERTLFKLKNKSRNFSNFRKQIGVGLKQVATRVSDEALVILQLMIRYDPDIRINVRRLLDHNFFNNLREDDVIRKFKNTSSKNLSNANLFNKSKGDFNLSSTSNPDGIKRKYKSSSSSDRSLKKKSMIPVRLTSKTTVDVTSYRPCSKQAQHTLRKGPSPLVASKQIKSWGVDPNILMSKDKKLQSNSGHTKNVAPKIKPPVQYQYKIKKILNEQNEYSKTMSNLPTISKNGYTENAKHYNQFQSKSFVLPTRHIIGPLKVKDIEPKKEKRSTGPKKKNLDKN